ncbi:MAG: c-type cytochrome biosis protein CcsB [Clostridia bacterium]|nr:c-type cytochrome biosis protein CcsB [Clostridia bacterium]
MLDEKQSFLAALILYSLASLAYIVLFISKNMKYSNYGRWLVRTGLVFHTLALTMRTVQTSYLPLTSQYEFASGFAWGISLFFVSYEWKYKIRTLGVFVTPLILIITFYAALQSSELKPLMPALQSKWLFVHVSTAVFSYGAFAMACAVSFMYLIRDKLKAESFLSIHMPELCTLDSISYKAITFGFFMLTIVIVTGAIWAERAWGRYWQWDPKETWSFITWVIYAIYLHVRLKRGWKNKRAAWYAIIGFLCILFTYIGVNTILSGYHSYGLLYMPIFQLYRIIS